MAERYTILGNIPGLDLAIARYNRLREYYFLNEPTIFGTAYGVFFRPFSKEYRPYWSLIGLLTAALLVQLLAVEIFVHQDR